MVIFDPEISFAGKLWKLTLEYIFFYHYRAFCMLYVLIEITFQFYFLRYKVVLYICVCVYMYNLIHIRFRILYSFFWNFFTHYNLLYTFYVLPPFLFPPAICYSMSQPYGKVPNYIQFPLIKITWKILYSWTRIINSFKNISKMVCRNYSKW